MRLYEIQMTEEISASIRKARRELSQTKNELQAAVAKGSDDEEINRTYDAVEVAELKLQSLIDLRNMNKLSDYGIDVPKEMYANTENSLFTSVGGAWVKRELRIRQREEIEFWFKLVLPILALVISIIALVKKSH
jgi:lipopolysaccharide export LptBFGC system permease protein LptF